MARRRRTSSWAKTLERSFVAMTRTVLRAGAQVAGAQVAGVQAKAKAKAQAKKRSAVQPGAGDWIAGIALGPAGACQFRLYRPPGVRFGERLPLLVMLHGCDQDAKSFARSTRMNLIAARKRFLVLYPEQDRFANAKGCWNWFHTRSGRAYGEADLIMRAIDQVCLLYPADRSRIAVAGLSAGASMAALLVTRQPSRFKALVMHSGVPPGAAHSTLSAVNAMVGLRPAAPLKATPETMAGSWPPLLVIHGGQDRVVAFRNAQAAVQAWADAAGARPAPERTVQRGQRYPMTVTDFKARTATVATLVQVGPLGHAWSGGAASQSYSDGQGPDASRMIWAFAEKQFSG
ncbi:MAG TPA: PHB depolymerase family esterase [Ramlibacter sp.]|nr:PHB depolymerase family esterase [Ramlibacter sp.]